MYTTIKVSREVKEILDSMKLSRSESYEDVILDLLEDHLELNPRFRRSLEQAEKEIAEGKTVELAELLAELEGNE
ncbi:MAG: hypothetical protein GXN93_02795 [Candidatus Diapherotrites archaeon]|nr:hypothetical protein [Candidatus Diapherotrites archaeon]